MRWICGERGRCRSIGAAQRAMDELPYLPFQTRVILITNLEISQSIQDASTVPLVSISPLLCRVYLAYKQWQRCA
ncbi:MAG: hypothetical protein H6656_11695 [Ardenticatenaceae bacterium]|nr:hypothetical protein [Ardenticatenaceae bacterium]